MHLTLHLILTFTLLLISFGLFITGLIGPLNPGHAVFDWKMAAFYFGLPILICLISLKLAKRPIEKVASVGIAGMILIIGGWVLTLILTS